MCLPPLIIAAVALEAAGGIGKMMGQKKADHAMTRTFEREHDRQKAFEAQQVADFQNSLNGTQQNLLDPNAVAAATDKRDAALMSAVHSAAPSSGGYMPGADSANPVVNADAKASGARADKHTSALASAMASLGAMGDLMQTNNINIGRNSGDISQIGGFMRGSMDALQPEMDAAKLKGSTLRNLGGLAQGIGQMMMAGAGGGGIPSPDLASNAVVGDITSGLPAFMTSSGVSLPGMAI